MKKSDQTADVRASPMPRVISGCIRTCGSDAVPVIRQTINPRSLRQPVKYHFLLNWRHAISLPLGSFFDAVPENGDAYLMKTVYMIGMTTNRLRFCVLVVGQCRYKRL